MLLAIYVLKNQEDYRERVISGLQQKEGLDRKKIQSLEYYQYDDVVGISYFINLIIIIYISLLLIISSSTP